MFCVDNSTFMNELAQNIILQGEENRPLPTGVTFRPDQQNTEHYLKPVLWIRISFNADLDPAFLSQSGSDSGSQTKQDPGQTLMSHEKFNILVNVHAPGSRSGSAFQYGSGSRTAKSWGSGYKTLLQTHASKHLLELYSRIPPLPQRCGSECFLDPGF